jgi:2-C-methyl-D-erythritol 2,4-cyclodiphosphate synthase
MTGARPAVDLIIQLSRTRTPAIIRADSPLAGSSGRMKHMSASEFRVGLGHDRHRLVAGRPLVLGGLKIDFELGLDGHSDADVLLHAITDAILGAAGLGDIGEWFPNTDPKWAGADSTVFLKAALSAVRERGWEVVNLDCTIHAERPKLSPHKRAIATNIAKLLEISDDRVNVKAKTGEKVGPIGRLEAIDADAVVMLQRSRAAVELSRLLAEHEPRDGGVIENVWTVEESFLVPKVEID